MKKFADYFEDAIAYGESLGLVKEPLKRYDWFSLSVKDDDCVGGNTPVIYTSSNEGITTFYGFLPERQQIKLIKMFISSYEQYLSDKKEPVAADSSN